MVDFTPYGLNVTTGRYGPMPGNANVKGFNPGPNSLLLPSVLTRFHTSVQTASFIPSGTESGKIYPLDASAGNITVTLPTAPAEGTRIGFILHAATGSAFDVTILRGGGDTIIHSGTLLVVFRMGKALGSYCELVYRTVGGVTQWQVLINTGASYFAGRYSAQVAVVGASNNMVFGNTLPSAINEKITHSVSDGSFTVSDEGAYFVHMPMNNGSNACDVRIQSPALTSPNPAVPSNDVKGKNFQLNGFTNEMQNTGALLYLLAGGTFDVRIISGSPASNETFLHVFKVN